MPAGTTKKSNVKENMHNELPEPEIIVGMVSGIKITH